MPSSSSYLKKAAKSTAKNLDDFKSEYDPSVRIPKAIKAGLAALLATGRESWEYEVEFIRRCGNGVSNTSLAQYRGPFEKHIVEVRQGGKNNKRVWFADVKIAAKARGG